MKWNHCHRPKRYWLCYLVAFFLLLGLGSLFPSSLASAYTGSMADSYQIYGSTNQYVSCLGCDYVVHPNSVINSIVFYYPNYGNGGYYAGQTIVLTGSFYANYSYGDSNKNKVLSSQCPVVVDEWFEQSSCSFDSYTDVAGTRHNVVYNYVITGTSSVNSLTPSLTLNVGIKNFSSDRDFYFYATPPSVKTSDSPAYNDYSSLLNDIKTNQQSLLSSLGSLNTSQIVSALSTLNTATSSTNSKLDDQTDLMEQQLQAQQDANDQQQEQYEAEKQEESDREEAGSEAVDDLTGGISFSITDPLSYIFGAFTSSNSCVSIPILKSWLHVSQSQFCPIFPSSIRSVLTPAFSMITGIFCYGFVVKWLKKDEG